MTVVLILLAAWFACGAMGFAITCYWWTRLVHHRLFPEDKRTFLCYALLGPIDLVAAVFVAVCIR